LSTDLSDARSNVDYHLKYLKARRNLVRIPPSPPERDMKELDIIGNNLMCPVVALIDDNKLLIGLRHYTSDKWQVVSVWTLPGGRCDEGETLRTTLEREVVEEIGITNFQISKFLGVVPGAKKGDVVYTFVGETKQKPKLMEPEKFSEWTWVDIDKVPVNFINNDALDLIRKSQQE